MHRHVVLRVVTGAAIDQPRANQPAAAGGKYPNLPSRTFRTATIEHMKYGRLETDCRKPHTGADLGNVEQYLGS